jgi:hypothetical protein
MRQSPDCPAMNLHAVGGTCTSQLMWFCTCLEAQSFFRFSSGISASRPSCCLVPRCDDALGVLAPYQFRHLHAFNLVRHLGHFECLLSDLEPS